MCGAIARVMCSAPNRLMSITSRHACRSASSTDFASPPWKALFTRMSMPPSSAAARSASSKHASGSTTSQRTGSARRPRASTSYATASSFASVRPPSTMSAPCCASASEMSRPMPGPMPDTTATLFSNNTYLCPPSSARERGADLGAEALDLLDQLVHRPRARPDLDLTDTERLVLGEHVGQLLGRPAEARPGVPRGLAHVDRPGDRADVDRVVPAHRRAVRADEFDGLRGDRALRQPAVTPLGGPAQRRLRRTSDPDGRSAGLDRPRALPVALERPARSVGHRVLVGERGAHRVDRLVQQAPPLGEVQPEQLELAFDVA